MSKRAESLIVIGASSGGLRAITVILNALPSHHKTPILIAQHLSPQSDNFWIKNLNSVSKYEVKEADEKEYIQNGFAYVAPPNYHLLVEHDFSLSLSADKKVNFSRPSIDVLFETAADAFKDKLIAILLTGASNDGAMGIKKTKDLGGITIVQDPSTAESSLMPESAISLSKVDYILPVESIADLLVKINTTGQNNPQKKQ